MSNNERSRLDLLLDLLTDEVARRLEGRRVEQEAEHQSPREEIPTIPSIQTAPEVSPSPEQPQELVAEPPADSVSNPVASTPSHAAALMARLAVGVLLMIILINVPLNMQGTALARSIPSSASLVIMNGLVVKEETSPNIYVYRDGKFHWITSLEAFDHFGYRWQDVHSVNPGFLEDFEIGNPLYVLLKCDSVPHIYRLEEGRKRWIVDIPTFLAEGHVWNDVKIVPCSTLHNLPDGESIPPGRGSPPPPLP
jgi:hypothetical protein